MFVTQHEVFSSEHSEHLGFVWVVELDMESLWESISVGTWYDYGLSWLCLEGDSSEDNEKTFTVDSALSEVGADVWATILFWG